MSVITDSGSGGGGDSAPERRPLRAIAAAIGLTAAGIIVSVAGGVVLAVPVLRLGLDVASISVLLGLTAAGQIGFLVVAYAYAKYANVQVQLAIPDRRDIQYIGGGVIAALVVAVGLSIVLSVLGLIPGSVIGDIATENPTFLLGLAFLSIVLVGPAEEFLFRGVIQTRLRRAFGPKGAIVGASLLFGSLHLANYTGAIVPIVAGALLISIVGGIFGVLYERSGNLVVSIIAHGVYNTILFGIAFLTI